MIVKTLIGKLSVDDQICNVTGTLSTKHSLTGSLARRRSLTGRLASIGGLTGRLAAAYTVPPEAYDGPYEATPMTVDQKLNTKEKYMNDDMSIRSIPYFDVSNTSGGSTVYIGTEIEFE